MKRKSSSDLTTSAKRVFSKPTDFIDFGEHLFFEITNHLDAVSIISMLRTSRILWKLRSKPEFASRIIPYQDLISEKEWDEGLRVAILHQHVPQVHYFLEKGEFLDLKEALKFSFSVSNPILINLLFQNCGRDIWLAMMALDEVKVAVKPAIVKSLLRGVPKKSRLMTFQYRKFFFKHATQNLELISLCLERGAPASSLLSGYLENGFSDENIVNDLIDRGAQEWNDYLCWAAYHGHKQLVDLFVQKGASSFGKALVEASKGGHLDLVKLFAEQQDVDDWSKAICAALRNNHKDVFQYLTQVHDIPAHCYMHFIHDEEHMKSLIRKAKPYSRSVNTALRFAVPSGDMGMIDDLLKKGACKKEALACAAEFGNQKLVDYFYDLNHKVTIEAFKQAMYHGHFEIASFFLDHGANPDLGIQCLFGLPYHKGRRKMLKLLIEKGATNLNEALIAMTEQGKMAMVQMLLEHGADDLDGALRASLNCYNFQAAEYFLKKGANLEEVKRFDMTDVVRSFLQRQEQELKKSFENNNQQ